MDILIFRICLLSSFLIAALIFGDWKNWQKYYSTILFVVVQNLTASFLTYHHVLWQYNPGLLVKTHTVVEILNAFAVLPAVTFTFLSKFPFNNSKIYQYGYIALWVLIFGAFEFTAHYIVGSLSYGNGWSLKTSIIFDISMFSLIRLHYSRPVWAWTGSLLAMVIILIVFNFSSGEFK